MEPVLQIKRMDELKANLEVTENPIILKYDFTSGTNASILTSIVPEFRERSNGVEPF